VFRKELEALVQDQLSPKLESSSNIDEPEQGWMRYFGVSPDDD
jgi:hypothetical protein